MSNELDFGRRVHHLSLGNYFSGIFDRRGLIVTAALMVLVLGVGATATLLGEASLGITDVWQVATGQGSQYANLVIGEWRFPRILTAIVFGAALAVSGAIFQSLTANPLGSPDIIGFQTGAYTGAIIVLLVLRGGMYATIAGALCGGVATAIVVMSLAQRRGRVSALRLIVVGIAISAFMSAINSWMLLKVSEEDAIMASLWGAGNLSGAAWETAIPAAILIAILLGASGFLVRPLGILAMGKDIAIAVGLRVRRLQLSAILVALSLTAISTAIAGPISFIALAAPQIAKRLTRTAEIPLAASMATGSLLLVLADVVAQHIYPASPLPVGLMTTAIGGFYFLWLLIHEGLRQ